MQTTNQTAFGGSRGNLMGGLLAGVAGAFIATTAMDALFDHGPGDFGLFDVSEFGF